MERTTSDDLQIQHTDGAVVVKFPTEVDIVNADKVHTTLLQVLASGAPAVVVDMTGCQFCDSSGIKALIRTNTRARELHTPLRIVLPPQSPVRWVLHIAGVTRLIPTLDSPPPLSTHDGSSRSGNQPDPP